MEKLLGAIILAILATGCTSLNPNEALGTMKNPPRVFNEPGNHQNIQADNPFIIGNYELLKTAHTEGEVPMRQYLAAGYALSDYYCSYFFRDADESQRRRKFGRAAFNDVGTAMAAVLGLANAGENIVTGVATGFGLGDNLWRNYDEAFVVSPNLSNVQQLVLAAQDNWRQRTLGAKDDKLPKSYATGQSTILRYANYCSTLGMQALLNTSSAQQKEELENDTEELRQDDKAGSKNLGTGKKNSQKPATASPNLAPG